MDDSTESRYDIILGKYTLATLGLSFEFSGNIIKGCERTFEVHTKSMGDLGK